MHFDSKCKPNTDDHSATTIAVKKAQSPVVIQGYQYCGPLYNFVELAVGKGKLR